MRKDYDSQPSLLYLDENIREKLLVLLDRNKVDDPGEKEMIQHIIDLRDKKSKFGSVPYRRSPEENAAVEIPVKELLSKG